MKSILLIITLILIPNICFGEVYIAYDKDNGEILAMEEDESFCGVYKNDVYIKKADLVFDVLPGKIKDYKMKHNFKYYTYSNESFMLDVDKLSADQLLQQQDTEKDNEIMLIYKKSLLLSKKALEKDGTIFNHVRDLDFN